jgi:hypothetical protein
MLPQNGARICSVFSPWKTKNKQNKKKMPWRRGAVDIAPASGTRRPGFKSRQGIRFLGKHSSEWPQTYFEKDGMKFRSFFFGSEKMGALFSQCFIGRTHDEAP